MVKGKVAPPKYLQPICLLHATTQTEKIDILE